MILLAIPEQLQSFTAKIPLVSPWAEPQTALKAQYTQKETFLSEIQASFSLQSVRFHHFQERFLKLTSIIPF